jgi:hypothetical protein
MPSDLAAFLAARLDEDEAIAVRTVDAGRLFRQIAAGRAILAAHRVVEYPGPYVPVSPTCSICITEREGYQEEWGDDDWPCATIRLLTAVYSDHPDYRQEWAPHG